MIDLSGSSATPSNAHQRERMLAQDLSGRGIRDPRVLEAFARLPREEFVPDWQRGHAYEDHPLDIGLGQTISQPYMAAAMTEWLQLTGVERVLEIGTGSGYQTAILARLCALVFSVERHAPLTEQAAVALARLGIENVRLRVGDGSLGWDEHAPFDRILITCAVPRVPVPLMRQLADGGRLVAPVGAIDEQRLTVLDRSGERLVERLGEGCRFVPLIGRAGYTAPFSDDRGSEPTQDRRTP